LTDLAWGSIYFAFSELLGGASRRRGHDASVDGHVDMRLW
jgi:hypothetical protein